MQFSVENLYVDNGAFSCITNRKPIWNCQPFEKRKNPKTRRITSESKEESPGYYVLIGRTYGSIDIIVDKNGIRNYK